VSTLTVDRCCGRYSLLAAVCQLLIVELIWRFAFVLGKFLLSDIETLLIPLLFTFVIGILLFVHLNFVNLIKYAFLISVAL